MTISKKMYMQIILLTILFVLEIIVLVISLNILSSVRAYIVGEGMYSKAQKEAIVSLQRYGQSRNDDDFNLFLSNLSITEGDKKARITLDSEYPDIEVATKGLIEGRNDERDVPNMIRFFQKFRNVSYLDEAIGYWEKGDPIVHKITVLGYHLHHIIQKNGELSEAKINTILDQVYLNHKKLALLEDSFSSTLAEGARKIEGIVLWTLIVLIFTVAVVLITIILYINNGISKGLNEINRAAAKISKGDLKNRITILSNDEIGQVANSINEMTDQLVRSNKEMEQFAYITSHDLQEPLRTIINFSELIQEQYRGKLDEEADTCLTYLNSAANRMQRLIKELLYYSKIGHEDKAALKDCDQFLDETLMDLSVLIQENNVEIHREKLPVVFGHNELKLLFQNLISNAIHHRDPSRRPIISISCKSAGSDWVFSVKDNGVGIDKKHQEKIFRIFQRLSSANSEGTGIGLAHCKKIVELHKGRIWIESKLGKGSTFYFSIPKTKSSV